MHTPDNVYFGEPGNDFSEYEDNRISIMLTEQLSDWWTFRIGATGLFYNLDSSQTAAINYTLASLTLFNPPVNPPQQFDRVRDVLDVSEQADSLIANLPRANSTPASINHKVLDWHRTGLLGEQLPNRVSASPRTSIRSSKQILLLEWRSVRRNLRSQRSPTSSRSAAASISRT